LVNIGHKNAVLRLILQPEVSRLVGDEKQSSQVRKDDDKGFSEGFLSID